MEIFFRLRYPPGSLSVLSVISKMNCGVAANSGWALTVRRSQLIFERNLETYQTGIFLLEHASIENDVSISYREGVVQVWSCPTNRSSEIGGEECPSTFRLDLGGRSLPTSHAPLLGLACKSDPDGISMSDVTVYDNPSCRGE